MRRLLPLLVLVATLLLWAGNWVVARAVRDDITPGTATLGRLALVLLVLLPFTLSSLRKKFPALKGKGVVLGVGFFGGGLHLACQWLGLHYTTATSATMYLSTAPIFILLLTRPLLGERIVARQWAGVAVSFCGVALIGTQGRLSLVSFNVGDALALFSMVFWATYTVLLRMRRDNLDIPELITVQCAVGAVTLLPWAAWEVFHGSTISLSLPGALAIVYSAFGSLLLAGWGWTYAVKRFGAPRAGVTMHLMPGITAGMAMIFLHEYPSWYHGAGIVLILGGVALSTLKVSSPASSP